MPHDADPCFGCLQLVTRPRTAPWCLRGAFYGQVGCLRKPPRDLVSTGHTGAVAPPDPVRGRSRRAAKRRAS